MATRSDPVLKIAARSDPVPNMDTRSDLVPNMDTRSASSAAAPRSGRRRGGRAGGRTGRGDVPREEELSRALSRLLRHQARNAGIRLDGEGFARLDEVLQWGPIKNLDASLEEVKSVVETNAKKRYALKPNPAFNPSTSADATRSPAAYLIRANQGHSLAVDASAMFTPIRLGDADLPARVIHGTYLGAWEQIVASGGLRPMRRGHIHCSDKTPEEGAVSGMRRDAELLVEIDLEGSLREGVAWWRSENGVILTEGGEGGVLGTRFFKSVRGRAAGVGLLWEDGVKRGDLPGGLAMGKRGGGRGGRR